MYRTMQSTLYFKVSATMCVFVALEPNKETNSASHLFVATVKNLLTEDNGSNETVKSNISGKDLD